MVATPSLSGCFISVQDLTLNSSFKKINASDSVNPEGESSLLTGWTRWFRGPSLKPGEVLVWQRTSINVRTQERASVPQRSASFHSSCVASLIFAFVPPSLVTQHFPPIICKYFIKRGGCGLYRRASGSRWAPRCRLQTTASDLYNETGRRSISVPNIAMLPACEPNHVFLFILSACCRRKLMKNKTKPGLRGGVGRSLGHRQPRMRPKDNGRRDDLCFAADAKSLADAKQFPLANCIFCIVCVCTGGERACIALSIFCFTSGIQVNCILGKKVSIQVCRNSDIFTLYGRWHHTVRWNAIPHCWWNLYKSKKLWNKILILVYCLQMQCYCVIILM